MRRLLCVGIVTVAVAVVAAPQTAEMAVVSSATFSPGATLAANMMVTAFTAAIPDDTMSAATLPLPTSLGGFSVSIRDAAGNERLAGLVSRSRGQISFVVPPATALGAAALTLAREGATVASVRVQIGRVAPGLFTANATGSGAPAGFVLQATDGGSSILSNLFERLSGDTRYEPRPFDLGSADGDMYLVLFGTGLRGAGTGAASARLGGVDVPVQAVAAHGKFEGLDQVNLGPLPGEIAGRRGVVDLVLTIEGIRANTVTVAPTYPPRGSWNRRADLLEANSEMAVALLDGKVFVLGGYPASRVTVPTVQVYDPATDSWTLTAPLPVAVNHPMPAAVNGKLYLIGGQTDANTAYVDNVQEYDPATRSWRQLARMPTQRGAGAAVVIEGKIYVAGGRPPRGADFAVYDPAQDQWTQLPNLPTQRNHLAAAAIGGKMYVVGGRFEGGFQSAQSDAVEIYDPQTNAWTNGAAMPKPRGGLNAVAAHGCLHVFGGEFGAGVHPDHDLYNPITNTWTSLDRMPTPVHGVTGAVFVDGLIYLPGGGISQGGSSGSRVHQVYRPNHACR